jgi:hypothetical protein
VKNIKKTRGRYILSYGAYPENVEQKSIATTDNAFYFFLVLLTTEIKGEL